MIKKYLYKQNIKKKLLSLSLISFMLIASAPKAVYSADMILYQIKSELFLKRLVIGNINEAYDLLLDSSPLKANKSNLNTLKLRNKQIIKDYGKPINFEFVKQKIFSKNKVSVQYKVNNQKFPLTWEFYYNKPKDEWLLEKINFL